MRTLTSWLQIIPAIALLCASPVDAQLVTVGGEFQVNTTTFTDEEESSVAVRPDGTFVVVWEGIPHPGPPAPVATWELNGVINSANPVPVTNTAADVSGSDLAKSVTLGSSNFANAFVATGWPTTPGIDTDRYFEFSVTPDVGFSIVYSTVEFSLYNSFNGDSDWEIRSSDDGFAEALDSGSATGIFGGGVSIVADVSRLGSESGTETFRFYSYNNTGTAPPDRRGFRGSAAGGDDLKVFGTVFVSMKEVFGQYYDATGAAVGGEFQVNTNTLARQDRPSVTTDAAGNYVVVWESGAFGLCNDGAGLYDSIAGQRYDAAGVPLGGEFLVSACPAGGGSDPQVAADAAGNFVVAYEHLRGAAGGIFAQRYDSAGVKVGAEFQVASAAALEVPAIASDPLGNFVIVWTDRSGLDGDSNGVFARRYDSAGNAAGGEFQVNTFTEGRQNTTGGAVDFDDAGNFVVVWGGDDGDLDGVYGQHFDAGGNPVGSEFRVNTTTVGDQHAPSVARDGPGNTLIVWVGEVPDFDITDREIFGQFYDTTGAAVGGEFRLNSTTLDIQTEPDVSANASGEFVVTWESRDTDAGDVFGQRLKVLGSGGEFQVNTNTLDEQEEASVAVNPDGSFLVVWEDNQIGEVVGQYYDGNDATVGGEFTVNTFTVGRQDTPSVSADAAGNNIVVWESLMQVCNSNAVYGQRYDTSGSEAGSEFLVSPSSGGMGIVECGDDPQVAASDAGNFIVAYVGLRNEVDGGDIFAQRYDSAGVEVGAEFKVNSTSVGEQLFPAIASGKVGNFVIVWSSGSGQDGDGIGVFARLYDSAGNAAGGEFQVNTFTAGNQYSQGNAVEFDDAGNFLIVWYSDGQDGDGNGVYGQYFDAVGTAVGSEFRINTTTVGPQLKPAVALDGPGNALIAWQGNGDGDDSGIFAQYYDTTRTAVGGELRLNSTTFGLQWEPAVSANSLGDFVVVWESMDSDSGDIFARRFTAPGDVFVDADGDGWADASDNCVLIPNAGTLGCDSDKDGYGNACDGDFNNDGTSDGVDFSPLFLADFFSGTQADNPAGNPQGTNMNCDGVVDGVDFATPFFLTQFGLGAPGPSGIGCAGSVPCPAAPGP